MNNVKLMKLLNDPRVIEINRLKPRAYRNYPERFIIDLNGHYDFHFYGNLQNRLNDYSEYQMNDSMIVPSCVELAGYGQLQYVNTQYPWDGIEDVEIGQSPNNVNYGFVYKRTFDIEFLTSGPIVLSFEGVESCFMVTVNGHFVGYAKDSFTTSEFEITNYISKGINEIIIEVFKYSATSFLDDQDFWRLSGIFRDVKIYMQQYSEIIDYDLSYDLNVKQKSAEVLIEIEKTVNFPVDVEFNYIDGSIIKRFTTNDSQFNFKVSNLRLWSAEDPFLYEIVFIFGDRRVRHNIGFRKIEIVNNVMMINEQKINFKGINRHEFSNERARALTKEDILADLELLKANNFNSIRTSHYPNNPIFYQLCDQLGFYVIDEANVETHGTWGFGIDSENLQNVLPNDNEDYYDAVKDRILNMYHRDKNFTSVLIWSLGNESFGGKIFYEMHNLLANLDNKRLVHYEGVRHDRRYPETSHIESQMYTTSESLQAQIDSNSIDKPFILCEFSHAMGNSNGNFYDYLLLERKNPQYSGGFLWEYIDQSIIIDNEEYYGGDFGDYPHDYNFICDGLVGANRRETSELKYVKNLLSPIWVNRESANVTIENTNLFTNYEKLIIEASYPSQDRIIERKQIKLKCQESYQLPIDSTWVNYKIFDDKKLLKTFSVYNHKYEHPKFQRNFKARFVDGNNNFGLHGYDFQIMFSKVSQNISQIKYDNNNLFADTTDTITPNFWRAPTNNDIGAKKHIELAICHSVSYFYTSVIKSYNYDGAKLTVIVEFTSPVYAQYKSQITYIVSSDGSIDVKFKTEGLTDAFNFGIKTEVNKKIVNYEYLGNGPFDSYSDRMCDMTKDFYAATIEKNCPYVFPQEYGNKTEVEMVSLLCDDTKFVITCDNYQFSLKRHNDNTLTNARHNHEVYEQTPFMRLNASQVGVGGDDSWGTWAKDQYRTNLNLIGYFKISKQR